MPEWHFSIWAGGVHPAREDVVGVLGGLGGGSPRGWLLGIRACRAARRGERSLAFYPRRVSQIWPVTPEDAEGEGGRVALG